MSRRYRPNAISMTTLAKAEVDQMEAEIARLRGDYARGLRDAAALIRAHPVEMRLTMLPNGKGEAVVRDLREELAKLVEGLGG